jgi:hypothetical protein
MWMFDKNWFTGFFPTSSENLCEVMIINKVHFRRHLLFYFDKRSVVLANLDLVLLYIFAKRHIYIIYICMST